MLYHNNIRCEADEMLNLIVSFAYLMSSCRKFNRITLAFSFPTLGAVLVLIFSIGAIDSFAQSELTMTTTTTTTGPIQDQERNATTTSVTQSLGNPFFVEQGRIIGQRVLAVTPQPQLEFSFMANASINTGDIVINAVNTGTSVSTLNADGTFRGEGQGILRTERGDVATWTNQVAGNLTPEGTIITRGVGFWSTPSTTGELAFMNGMITVFEVQVDREGNLSAREWEWS
jgi:hypothetical protein